MQEIFTNTDLFRTINEYTDLRSLCDTCSFGKNQEFLSKVAKGKLGFPTCLLFATLKKYINYKLNKQYSLMYHDDILYRTIVLNKIFNPLKQLKLNLSCFNNITDVSVLCYIHTLNLSSCVNIFDVSALENTHTLNLSGCYNITDVSMLGNVHLVKN